MLARASHISDMHDIDIKTLTEACQMASYEFYLIMIESVIENYPYTAYGAPDENGQGIYHLTNVDGIQ